MRLVRPLLLVLIEVMWIKGTMTAPKLWTTPKRRNIDTEVPSQGDLDPSTSRLNEGESYAIGIIEEVLAQNHTQTDKSNVENVETTEAIEAKAELAEILVVKNEDKQSSEVNSDNTGAIGIDVMVNELVDEANDVMVNQLVDEANAAHQKKEEIMEISNMRGEKEFVSEERVETEHPFILIVDTDEKSHKLLQQVKELEKNEDENVRINLVEDENVRINLVKDENVRINLVEDENVRINLDKDENVRINLVEDENVRINLVKDENVRINLVDDENVRINLVKDENVRINLVKDEVHDSPKNMDTVFPAEINVSDLGSFTFSYPDYAANEMIDRIEGDTKVFEALRKKMHYLEESMNNHRKAKLFDDKQVEDAQMILEIMDEKMLRPFFLTLEAVREQIIKMDHSLKGDTLDYVQGLVKRAENFLSDAQEKLTTVAETDEEENDEEENDNALERAIDEAIYAEWGNGGKREINEAIDVEWTNGEKSVEIPESTKEVHYSVKAIKKDIVSKYHNLDNLEKSNNDQIPSSKGIKGQIKNGDFVPTEQPVVVINTEDQNMLNGLKDHVVAKKKSDEVTERPEDVIVDNERMRNPKIKLLLETTDFLKNNNEQTHEHDFSKENVSWAAGELILPFFTLVVLSAAIIALVFSRIKKKQVVAVNSLNDYDRLETVSSLQNPHYNYYKLK